MDAALFLAERYAPGATAERMEADVQALVSALRSRPGARLLGALFVPSDEMLLCIVTATSAEAARLSGADAGMGFDRVSGAIELRGGDPE